MAKVSSTTEVIIYDKETKAEQWGFAIETFARGPDTILYGSLWVPVVLYLASLDGICSNFNGQHSSGADGQACLHDSNWNETLWNLSNGSKCIQFGDFDTQKYTHDPLLPGCVEAVNTYRTAFALTSSSPYTCNCTGDYSLLSSGMRPQNIFVIQNWVNSILIAIACPIFGSLIDSRGGRLQKWKTCILVAALSIVGTAILSSGGIWIISLVFFAFLHIATELVWLTKASYLGDIAKDDVSIQNIVQMCFTYHQLRYHTCVSSHVSLYRALPVSRLTEHSLWGQLNTMN